MSIGTIVLIVLGLMLVGAIPAWPHSRGWGYAPSSVLGLAGSGGLARSAADGPPVARRTAANPSEKRGCHVRTATPVRFAVRADVLRGLCGKGHASRANAQDRSVVQDVQRLDLQGSTQRGQCHVAAKAVRPVQRTLPAPVTRCLARLSTRSTVSADQFKNIAVVDDGGALFF